MRPARFAVLTSLACLSLVAGLVGVAPTIAAAAAIRPTASDAPSDSTSAPNEADAASIAAQYDHPVLVDSESTATDKISVTPDGDTQLDASSTPQLVPDGSSWVPVDTTLTTTDSGTIAPAATDVPVEFGAGGSTTLAKIQDADGDWITEGWKDGTLPTPTVSGSTATYNDVLPDVDLKLTATSMGMSEVIVVNSPTAAANPALADLKLQISGATVADASGGRTVASTDGDAELSSAAPTWWDSSVAGSDASGPDGSEIAQPVDHSASGNQISMDVQTPAQSAGVTYPVYVDPDWNSTFDVDHYWFIDSAYPSTSYLDGAQSTTSENMGYLDSSYASDGKTHKARAFYEISMQNSNGVDPLAGKHIFSATLNTTEVWSFNCTASKVDLYMTPAVSDSDTYNSIPSNAFSSGTKLDDKTVAHGHDSGCPEDTVGFDASDSIPYAVANNPNVLKFGLKADDETTSTSWKRFSPTAHLVVLYDTPPATPVTPEITAPARECAGTSQSAPALVNDVPQAIGLSVDAEDADKAKGDKVTATFALTQLTGSGTAPIVSSSTAAVVPGTVTGSIAQNALTEGAIYSWTASSKDLDLRSSPGSSTPCFLEQKSTPPTLPTVTMQANPTYVVGQPLQVTISDPNIAADGNVRFAYWIVDGASSGGPAIPVAGGSVTSFNGSLPACGSGAGSVRYACIATGTTATVTVAATSATSTLWVSTIDGAGNVSTVPAGSNGNAYSTGLALYGASGQAANDTTDINYGVGHGWSTNPSATGTTLTDQNTGSGVSISLDATAALDPVTGTNGALIDTTGYTELDRFENSSSGYYLTTEAAPPASSYSFQISLGLIKSYNANNPVTPSGMQLLYVCPQNNGNRSHVAVPVSCTTGATTPLGYTYLSQPVAPSVQIYSCVNGSQYYTSTSSTCGTSRISVGWVLTSAGAATTSSTVVNLGSTFEVSAHLTTSSLEPNSVAVAGTTSTDAGFTIGTDEHSDGNEYWQFCLDTSDTLPTPDCVDSGTSATTDGSAEPYITGVWDAANQQIRILINGNVSSAAWHAAPATGYSAVASLKIGQGVDAAGAPVRWNGQVGDLSTFPGVPVLSQLNRTKLGLTPQ